MTHRTVVKSQKSLALTSFILILNGIFIHTTHVARILGNCPTQLLIASGETSWMAFFFIATGIIGQLQSKRAASENSSSVAGAMFAVSLSLSFPLLFIGVKAVHDSLHNADVQLEISTRGILPGRYAPPGTLYMLLADVSTIAHAFVAAITSLFGVYKVYNVAIACAECVKEEDEAAEGQPAGSQCSFIVVG